METLILTAAVLFPIYVVVGLLCAAGRLVDRILEEEL